MGGWMRSQPDAGVSLRHIRGGHPMADGGTVCSVDAANGMIESPDLKAAMDKAGVTAPPRIEMYEEVEAVQY